jgi:small subunit ribosomal protein S13
MRLLGITIPDKKTALYGLTTIYGIGLSRSGSILDQANVGHDTKIAELTADQETAIRKIVDELKLEGNLKREIGQNIKRLKDISCYRGSRHARNMPTRGQRTKTNSRTVRGNKRVTMASGRKTVSKT